MQKREGPVQQTGRFCQPLLHARRASHLEFENVLAVPYAEDCPRLGRVGKELVRPGEGECAAGDGEEGSEVELVGEDGVDVPGEELGSGEAAAVQGLGVGRGEFEDGDLSRGEFDSVGVNGLDENGGGTELGVAAFVGEEVNGGLVVVIGGYVGIFGTFFTEPLLHFLH